MVLFIAVFVLVQRSPNSEISQVSGSSREVASTGLMFSNMFAQAGGPQQFLQDFADAITNAAPLKSWRSWALVEVRASANRSYDSRLFDGVELKKDRLPSYLPRPDGIVGGAVVDAGKATAHVEVCWGGHEIFYSLIVGDESFSPAKGPDEYLMLDSGIYVCLKRDR